MLFGVDSVAQVLALVVHGLDPIDDRAQLGRQPLLLLRDLVQGSYLRVVLLVHARFVRADLVEHVGKGLADAGEHASRLLASRALDLSTALNYHFQVPLVLLYLVIKDAVATLALQLNLFLDILELFVDGFDFEAPLKRVELRLQYLVLFGLLKEVLLLLLESRVEETDLSLFYTRLCDLSAQVCIARPAVFQHGLRPTDQIPGVFLGLNLNAVDFLGALQVGVVLEVVHLAGLVHLLRKHGLVKLVLPPVQLNVQQLVDDVADVFSVSGL